MGPFPVRRAVDTIGIALFPDAVFCPVQGTIKLSAKKNIWSVVSVSGFTIIYSV
jgi:hypothetical protein